jgi:hypothetical protein
MAPLAQRGLLWLGIAALLALASGCSPKIGDKCTVSTDCSVNGDRLCDSTEPSGYCTVFNCEPNACPDDSLCVAFTEPTCSSPAQSVRFTRTFCMATCESDGDCRAGYLCLDVTNDEVRQVLDINPSTRRICAVAPRSASMAEASTSDSEPAICNAFDGSFSESSVTQSDAGDAGDSSTRDATPIDGDVDAAGEASTSAGGDAAPE